jgi:threonine dehydrogenase-like Zn-dependent dehydrogenase
MPDAPPPDQKPAYVVGLDLGQASDFTALAVLERTVGPDPAREGKTVNHFAVRHLERFFLGTPYTAITERLVRVFEKPPLRGALLAVDQTGVGRAVVDMIRKARVQAVLRPVTITGGHALNVNAAGGWLVPKKDLVGVMQVLLQARRLTVAPRLAEAQTLVKELQNFRIKITAAANEVFEAWRDGQHDDLVLAVAVAAWVGERPAQAYHFELVRVPAASIPTRTAGLGR